MIVAERLVDRIKASGLSYTAVANRVGVKQPTITRLAGGKQYRTTRLPELARVLHTTPEYLKGEIDDPSENAPPSVPVLDHDEWAWVEYWRALDDAGRDAVVRVVRLLTSNGKYPDSAGK